MTREEQRAYMRGYSAGMRRVWPLYRPPHPPQSQVQALFDAADALREAAVSVLSVIIPDEPVFLSLQEKANAMDDSFAAVAAWLKRDDGEETAPHIDHPLRHFDRTCLACWQETEQLAEAAPTGTTVFECHDCHAKIVTLVPAVCSGGSGRGMIASIETRQGGGGSGMNEESK